MAVYDPQIPWVQEQNALWRELAGATITGWEGFDYHIGGDDDELTFLGKDDPFRQLGLLRMLLGDGSAIDFDTFQNEEFGLALSRGDGELGLDDGYARPSDLSDLPVGPVDLLEIHLDDHPSTDFDPIEVLLTIAGRSVLIVAAEVRPDWEGVNYCWSDESYFVFADPTLAEAIEWKGAGRRFVTREIGPGPNGGDVFDGSRRRP